MIRPMAITVVGSMPVQPSTEELASGYQTGEDPFERSLERAVAAQVECGVEIVSDGQTRDTMVNVFARHLRGIRMKERPIAIADIEWKGSIALKDLERARSILPKGRVLKGLITGPYTMSKGVVDQHYNDPAELATAFARALNSEARAIEPVVNVIQLDEPFFSVEYPSIAKELVKKAFEGITKPKALHVCGDVSKVFDRLTEMPVDILDHEFAAHPGLLSVLKEHSFKQSIGYGCVRSDDVRIETVDEIAARLQNVMGITGHERLLVDPDCGLRNIPLESALGKLRNMAAARDRVMADAR
ncbi:MAG: methionine synthase [Euryarchaeota archaeon]|nr:methionine synthase [Euryarchaeota archaeon]